MLLFIVINAFATDPIALVGSKIPVVDNATLQSAVSGSTLLTIVVGLDYRDNSGITQYAKDVCNPASSSYRSFLTPAQILSTYGPTSTNLTNVQSFLTTGGLTIDDVSGNGLVIIAHGTVSQLNSLFSTTINNYTESTTDAKWRAGENATAKNFYANNSDVLIPANISSVVTCVSGLNNFFGPISRTIKTRKAVVKDCSTAASQPQGPTQTRKTYNEKGLWELGTPGYKGTGVTVAVMSFNNLPDVDKTNGAVAAYANDTNNQLPVPSGGPDLTRIPIPGYSNTSTFYDQESTGDMECVIGMAPKATILCYDGANTGTTAALIASLDFISSENKADIINLSYGFTPTYLEMSQIHKIQLSLTAQGVTMLSASGDDGIYLFFDTYYPNIEPEILQVGGTVVFADSSGLRCNEYPWGAVKLDSSTFYEPTIHSSGSGYCNQIRVFRGASLYNFSWNSLPSWQHGSGVPNWINNHLFPDVSLAASSISTGSDNATGAYSLYLRNSNSYQPSLYSAEGTSLSSPTWADSLALVLQYLKDKNVINSFRLGRIQDLLYEIRTKTTDSDVWHDITTGSVSNPYTVGYDASVNWDFASGWGSSDFYQLALKLQQDLMAFVPVADNLSGVYSTSTSSPFTLNLSIPSYSSGTHTIYYTTDGSDPSDSGNSNRHTYSSAIQLSTAGAVTVKAVTIATISCVTYQSSIMSETYYLRPPGSTPYIVYVNKLVTSSGNGSSWTQAKKTVAEGLQFAAVGDQVWVAKSTYYENITLPSGVTLYGGFTSGNTFSQRNPATKPTYIDGGRNGSVVNVAYGADSNTTIDGFIIQTGKSKAGAGLNSTLSQIKVLNCTFKNNAVYSFPNILYGGAGIYISGTSYNFDNNHTLFTGNSSVLQSKFTNNNFSATGNRFGSGILLAYCLPTDNTNSSVVRLANNLLYDNFLNFADSSSTPTASLYTGSLESDYCSITASNNTISNTPQSGDSGTYFNTYTSGIYAHTSVADISNNIIASNYAGIYSFNSTVSPRSVTLNRNDVYNNPATSPASSTNNYLTHGTDPPLDSSNDLSPSDPGFYNPFGSDFHLFKTSSLASYCYNQGDNSYVLSGDYDLDILSRIWSTTVDLGCFEIHGNTGLPIVPQFAIHHP